MILGIESSFDESAASLVNSFGEIQKESKYTLSEINQVTNGVVGIDPRVAQETHEKYVP